MPVHRVDCFVQANVVALAMEDVPATLAGQELLRNDIAQEINFVSLIIFTVEAVLKISANGLCSRKTLVFRHKSKPKHQSSDEHRRKCCGRTKSGAGRSRRIAPMLSKDVEETASPVRTAFPEKGLKGGRPSQVRVSPEVSETKAAASPQRGEARGSIAAAVATRALLEAGDMRRLANRMPSIHFTKLSAELDFPLTNGRQAYLSNAWNRMDLIVVLVGYVELMVPSLGTTLSAFRAIRALRTLRAFHFFAPLKVIISAIGRSAAFIVNVLVVLGFFYLFFALMGIQLYRGSLRRKCVIPQGPDASNYTNYDNLANLPPPQDYTLFSPETTCSFAEDPKDFTCPDIPTLSGEPVYCLDTGRSMYDNQVSYDYVWNALLTVFISSTLEGWTTIMYASADSEYSITWLYYVAIVVVINFFGINLFTAVISNVFSEVRAEEAEKEKKARQARRRKRLKAAQNRRQKRASQQLRDVEAMTQSHARKAIVGAAEAQSSFTSGGVTDRRRSEGFDTLPRGLSKANIAKSLHNKSAFGFASRESRHSPKPHSMQTGPSFSDMGRMAAMAQVMVEAGRDSSSSAHPQRPKLSKYSTEMQEVGRESLQAVQEAKESAERPTFAATSANAAIRLAKPKPRMRSLSSPARINYRNEALPGGFLYNLARAAKAAADAREGELPVDREVLESGESSDDDNEPPIVRDPTPGPFHRNFSSSRAMMRPGLKGGMKVAVAETGSAETKPTTLKLGLKHATHPSLSHPALDRNTSSAASTGRIVLPPINAAQRRTSETKADGSGESKDGETKRDFPTNTEDRKSFSQEPSVRRNESPNVPQIEGGARRSLVESQSVLHSTSSVVSLDTLQERKAAVFADRCCDCFCSCGASLCCTVVCPIEMHEIVQDSGLQLPRSTSRTSTSSSSLASTGHVPVKRGLCGQRLCVCRCSRGCGRCWGRTRACLWTRLVGTGWFDKFIISAIGKSSAMCRCPQLFIHGPLCCSNKHHHSGHGA